MGKIRVAIVEDHPVLRQAIRQQLEQQPDFSVVLELSHGAALPEALQRSPVDLVLLDLGMDVGVFDPATTVRRLRAKHTQMRLIVVSSYAYGETVLGVLSAGVHGYVLKTDLTTLDLPGVIRQVMAGGQYFSPAIEDLQSVLAEIRPGGGLLDREECDLLNLAAQGHTNRQIGHLLGYSEKTVRNRFTPIYRKLGASNRVD